MIIKTVEYPAPGYMTPRSLADVTDLIFHHSDGSPTQTPLEIDAEHRAEGWSMIGYNFVIAGDGTVYEGRPLDVVPSAAYGRNAQSIDVCLLGDFQPGTQGYAEPSVAQVNAAGELSVYVHQRYPQIVRTIGHRDVATMFYPNDPGDYSTACPGDTFEAMLAGIRAYTRDKLAHK